MHAIGLTIPFTDCDLRGHREVLREAADLGYTSAWSSESSGADAITPLALAAAWQPRFDLAAAVVPVQTRGAALLAQGFAALAESTAGQVTVGLGASTPTVVENWNAVPFGRPYQRIRDTVRFLRAAFTGEKVSTTLETFAVSGFRLLRPPARMPRIMLAAGRPGMLRLAGREADGAIVNWVSPDDVAVISRIVQEAALPGGVEVVARLFVCPSPDAAAVREAVRPFITQYLTPPGYRDFHRWIGRSELLDEVFELWDRGERRRSAAALPDAVIDALVVHGPPGACLERIQAYLDAGLTGATLAPLGVTMGDTAALRRLGPVSGLRARAAALPPEGRSN